MKIYLDMDGVLADFEGRYIELFNETPDSTRDKKNFSPNWEEFIKGGNFATLDKWPGCDELLAFIKKLHDGGNEVEILSSSGGKKFHGEVTAQKIKWLRKQGIEYRANIVPGRGLKKDYATPNTILIDDTPDVIDSFNKAGGHGILHKNVGDTIKKLKDLLAK